MADTENPVLAQEVPPVATDADNEAVRQAALGRPPRPRNAFVPKPVAFLPLDIIRFLDELASLERLASNKVSPALDGTALVACSLRNGVSVNGKVLGIDASVDNMRPIFESKTRLFEKMINTVTRLMQQDEDGVDPKIFDSLATIVSDIHAALTQDRPNVARSIKLSVSLPLLHVKCIPALKAVVQVKALPHHTKLMACRLIEDMEQWKLRHHLDPASDFPSSSIPALNRPILDLILGSTSNASEKAVLRCKFSLICSLSSPNTSTSSSAIISYQNTSLQAALDVFPVMPATLLDSVFDLTLTCLAQDVHIDTMIQYLQWIRDSTEPWSELDRVLLRSRLMDLSRIYMAQHPDKAEAKQIITQHIPEIFKSITFGFSNTSTWSVGAASKVIETLCVTLERDLSTDLTLATIPQIMSSLEPFFASLKDKVASTKVTEPSKMPSLRRSFGGSARSSSGSSADNKKNTSTSSSKSETGESTASQATTEALELLDVTMRRAFDYLIVCLNSYHPAAFLDKGFAAVVEFVQKAFGKDFESDCKLLNSALLLATLFVQQKSDPSSFNTFFSNHMVESFERIISWHGSPNESAPTPSRSDISTMRKLCIDILEFGYACVHAGNTNRYKFFCWFMPPIYVLVDSLPNSSNQEKMEIVSEIVSTCFATLQKGNDIDLLLRDGVPMVLNLFRLQSSQIVPTLRMVATKLLQHNSFWSLLQMNFCLESAQANFASFASKEGIDNYFRFLISKGQRRMINASNEVIVAHLSRPQYYGIRNYLFATFEPNLGAFQSLPFPDTVSDPILQANLATTDGTSSESTSEHELLGEKPLPKYKVNPANLLHPDSISDLLGLLASVFAVDRNDKGVMKIISRLLADVLVALERREFNSETVDHFRDHLSRVLLFKNLFPQLLAQHAETSSPEVLAKLFNDTFPADVIRDEETMSTLSMLGTRIERVTTQLPKFQHVANATTELLNSFFSWKPALDMKTLDQQIYYRKRHLRDHVFNLPQNVALRDHLLSVGYHPDFFSRDLEIRVDIDDRRNLEENFKTILSNLYMEYLDIVKELYSGIKNIHYEGAEVPLEDFFVENHRTSFTIEDLRSRRNHAIKMIDKRLKAHANRINLQNRKLSLLTREEGLEETLEKDKLAEGLAPPQRRRYWVRLNSTYWRVAACCGKQIAGCYAPNGDHAEKILENSMKANVGIFSLYESNLSSTGGKKKKKQDTQKSKKKKKRGGKHQNKQQEPLEDEEEDVEEGPGLEIENIEVLFTDQGLYTFKLYTNGHNLDTTLAWLQFFKVLASSRMVPAIIVPNNFPTVKIFNQLESFVPSQISGSIITYKDSFFDEFGVTSYYDIAVEKIKQGDIVLDEESSHQIFISDNVDLHQGDGLKSSGSRSILIESTGMDVANISDKELESMKTHQKKIRPQMDFSGMVLTSTLRKVKQRLNDDQELFPFIYTVEAFVRFISQYLSLFLEKGIRDVSLISVGLDLESWNRRKQVKNVQAQLTESIKTKIVALIAHTIHEELDQFHQDPKNLATFFYEHRSQFFELRSHWMVLEDSLHLDHNDREDQHPMTDEMIEQQRLDAAVAKRALALARQLMAEVQTTVSYDIIPRQPQEQIIKWIFGNEDRVWRERGGRPGEETLSTFINFCRTYEADPNQLTQAQQQVRLSTQAQQFRQQEQNQTAPTAPTTDAAELSTTMPSSRSQLSSSSEAAVLEDEPEPLSSFKGHHYGNVPWGGYVTVATVPNQDKESPSYQEDLIQTVSGVAKRAGGSGSSNKELVAYCIGDYIAADDFEVITAWVHPQYRSFGLALDLYKRTAYRVFQSGGQFVTFDVLLGTIDHLTRTAPAIKILHTFGLLQKIIVKRRDSHSSETEHGTEKFERLTISLKWLVLAFRLLDWWSYLKNMFSRILNPGKHVTYPWRQWYVASAEFTD